MERGRGDGEREGRGMGERRERDVEREGGELCLLQFEDVVLAS